MTYTDATALIRLLDTAENLPEAIALRSRTYELLRLHPGAAVVDVGCGAGRAVAELGAHAIGVDPDPVMLATARDRFPSADFRAGGAGELPVADGAVAGYRADKVFHVVPDPAAALREARRVLAPGGRIVLIGQDWDTQIIESSLPELTRRIVHARAATIAHPRIARGYRNLLLDAGFHDVALEVHAAVFTDATTIPLLTGHATAARDTGAITPGEAGEWLADQRQRAAADRLLLALPLFLASGTR
ncbi:methyltransferase domain-containing protein [Actinoplanes sp. NPDC051851]|uniref:methyltransferase domain-containing protein n=1 Tax=Actinoplanes sp. NPDC051851 TaxID=3154753 RepID=UPI00344373EC